MFKGLSGLYHHREHLLMQEYFDDELASQVFVICKQTHVHENESATTDEIM